MPDFLLELRSEEIPARMQAKACADLTRLFVEQLAQSGLSAAIETHATPRRLALIARGLPEANRATAEEVKGPRADAPPQALAGFLGKVGLTRDQLEERADAKGNAILFAVIDRPGRATAEVLAEAIPAIVRAFPWPKSMRWGAASASTESPRWVRPLQGIVALLGEQIVPCEIAGIASGAATLGHRFHHPGVITIGSADDYETKLRACHVVLRADERAQIIRDGATAAAAAAGLTLVEDEALVAENAGLTEWPVPLLGTFEPAFLDVPREVIQLTMRANQKYFACTDAEGNLAPAFICTANIDASDGGAAIVQGNQRVLSARLSDAKFFWEADLKVPLDEQAAKLDQIVFHEKLGTVADKVARVAKLAAWLVEEGIVGGSSHSPATNVAPAKAGASARTGTVADTAPNPAEMPASAGMTRSELAALTERAARLCKADLVTQMVAEFPELQGTIGAHLARAQGEDAQVADAIRDHYKPVGQGDEVPTAPVTVAVSLADKLDTLISFFAIDEKPTGSKDPFALRRSALGAISLLVSADARLCLTKITRPTAEMLARDLARRELLRTGQSAVSHLVDEWFDTLTSGRPFVNSQDGSVYRLQEDFVGRVFYSRELSAVIKFVENLHRRLAEGNQDFLSFLIDRLKVQQREAGVRHDLIDAVFALGGEGDLVRLLARVRALQAFVETPEGRDLLAGYKRAANILKKEGWSAPAEAGAQAQQEELGSRLRGSTSDFSLSYSPDPVESSLVAALDSAEPLARAAIEGEDFAAAMAALATLRVPVDAFFETVIVNDPDPPTRAARLSLLARMRDAVHAVADFSKIEG